MKSEFIDMLVEGRPKKGEEGRVKEKRDTGKKRGRPAGSKKDDDNDEKFEGLRKVTLKATVKKEDGKYVEETKKLGTIQTDTVDSQKKIFEKELYSKYGFDADVEDIEVFFDSEKVSAKASDFRRQDDDSDFSVVGK